MKEKIQLFQNMLHESNAIVFFGGAGVSTESGIPDFRSQDGLYHQHYQYPPERILSHTFFMEHPGEFYKFYREKMNCLNYEPNITHQKLAELEKRGKLKAVVTQNIDGLHQKAGSQNVYELHGSVWKNECMKCHKAYMAEEVFQCSGIPQCGCGGMIKSEVVLYEEALKQEVLSGAIHAIERADMLIIGGTSLMVQPASSLIRYYHGQRLVLINQEKTAYDDMANLVIHERLGKVFEGIE